MEVGIVSLLSEPNESIYLTILNRTTNDYKGRHTTEEPVFYVGKMFVVDTTAPSVLISCHKIKP